MCNIDLPSDEERTRRAWHEGGHAVASIVQGYKVDKIIICSEKGESYTKIPCFEYYSQNPSCLNELPLESQIKFVTARAVVSVAGVMAEKMWSEEKAIVKFAVCDERITIDSLSKLNKLDDEVHKKCDIEKEAHQIVSEYLRTINKVAGILVDDNEISGDCVEDIIRKYNKERH